MQVAKDDFIFVCELVRSKSGIILQEGREYLVEGRLGDAFERTPFEKSNSYRIRQPLANAA